MNKPNLATTASDKNIKQKMQKCDNDGLQSTLLLVFDILNYLISL